MKKKIRFFWLGIFGLVCLLLLWVNQSVRSTELSYRIQKVSDLIKAEQEKIYELERRRNRFLALDFIEAAAKRSGLVVPKEENVVIVNLSHDR